MNAPAKIEKRGRIKPMTTSQAIAPADAEMKRGQTALVRLVPSTPQLLPLNQLHRARENVRHVRIDEDVDGLAADIASHGLLTSLIGYDEADINVVRTMIVGGGRRLQALIKLWEDGLVDGTFLVPVLIRGVEEAVELSLAENLQQRTMSPADEFLAFKALIDTGHHNPEGLAKRFGWKERAVKQRLRLADVVPEVLDALAEQRITIDAATAYATTQDRTLQLEVFKVQDKRGWEPHRPNNIRHDITNRGMRTTDPIFTFVGAEIYERDGGGYEDDLFVVGTDTQREGKVLDRPFVARAAAERMIDFQAIRLIEELKRDPKLAPTIVGHVRTESLRLYSYGMGNDTKLDKPPAGYVEVDRRYGEEAPVWRAIRNHGVDVLVVVGIDDKGELTHYARRLFVPKADKDKVDKQTRAAEAPKLTAEQQATADRLREVNCWSRRLALGAFTGTPLEGRAFWPTGYNSDPRGGTQDGVNGWIVPVEVFVAEEAAIAAQGEAEAYVDQLIAARDAKAKRTEQLLAADPPPAVILVDGLLHYRWSNNLWSDDPEPAEHDDASPRPIAYRLQSLLFRAKVIGPDWPSTAAQRADAVGGAA